MDGCFTAPEYPLCKEIRRKPLNVAVSDDVALKLVQDRLTVLPLFERCVYDHKWMKHTSLETNELLKCRWQGYLDTMEGKKRQPFQFPHLGDYHYSNYFVRFNPSLSINKRVNHRVTMRSGPGVDEYGQIPIPEDMNLRKTVHGKFRYDSSPCYQH